MISLPCLELVSRRRRMIFRFFCEASLTAVSMLRQNPTSLIQKKARKVTERTTTYSAVRRKRIVSSDFKRAFRASSQFRDGYESAAGRDLVRAFCEAGARTHRWCSLQSHGGGPRVIPGFAVSISHAPDFLRGVRAA